MTSETTPTTRRILRVFPRRTNATPTDEPLVAWGQPTFFSTRYDVDEVHVSVAFTWDMPKAERIARVYESYRHRIRGAKRTQVFGCMHMVGLARCWPEWAILGCRLRPD